ncbi:MAG: DNA helicase RecQ [Phycisphaerae bacterium]
MLRRYWGYESFRPLQAEAIAASLAQRDSLVVLPTGGGKSICYQAPPAVLGRLDVVASPLIALMKDQVDGLRVCGYPAAALHTGITPDERRALEGELLSGRLRLLFAAPERLVQDGFQRLLQRAGVRAFAIDEAHCISQWGHDFRPEYRRLAELRERFAGASFHAYTATATERVRADIVGQLRLRDPVVLVGSFDRPNLTYRVVPKEDVRDQVVDVLRRHAGDAAIVYCISRRETEELAAHLNRARLRAAYYHAGLDAACRRRTQDDFAQERIDVVVATVAFGMGIDRSDVRCVIHTALPKSIEHYQQETGRAGRDGLEAECVLLYSGADVMRWESLIRKSAQEAAVDAELIPAMRALLGHMQRFCVTPTCRHRAIVRYFGQALAAERCGACDVCLDEVGGLVDATVLAQKVISCVARVRERFGVVHVVDVLRGERTERVLRCGHDQLSTFGLLAEIEPDTLAGTVRQLVDAGLLTRTDDEYPVLKLNADSWRVLRGERPVRLMQAPAKRTRGRKRATRGAATIDPRIAPASSAPRVLNEPRAPATAARRVSAPSDRSWAGVDRELFELLRGVRRELAGDRAVPPFMIFSDATLRDLARRRPSSIAGLMDVRGVGERKRREFGARFLAEIAEYCREHGVGVDAEAADISPEE